METKRQERKRKLLRDKRETLKISKAVHKKAVNGKGDEVTYTKEEIAGAKNAYKCMLDVENMNLSTEMEQRYKETHGYFIGNYIINFAKKEYRTWWNHGQKANSYQYKDGVDIEYPTSQYNEGTSYPFDNFPKLMVELFPALVKRNHHFNNKVFTNDTIIDTGKYKNQTLGYVKSNDDKYYQIAMDLGAVDNTSEQVPSNEPVVNETNTIDVLTFVSATDTNGVVHRFTNNVCFPTNMFQTTVADEPVVEEVESIVEELKVSNNPYDAMKNGKTIRSVLSKLKCYYDSGYTTFSGSRSNSHEDIMKFSEDNTETVDIERCISHLEKTKEIKSGHLNKIIARSLYLAIVNEMFKSGSEEQVTTYLTNVFGIDCSSKNQLEFSISQRLINNYELPDTNPDKMKTGSDALATFIIEGWRRFIGISDDSNSKFISWSDCYKFGGNIPSFVK